MQLCFLEKMKIYRWHKISSDRSTKIVRKSNTIGIFMILEAILIQTKAVQKTTSNQRRDTVFHKKIPQVTFL